METRTDIHEIPKALSETFAKGRVEFEGALRAVRWGESPIFLTGAGLSRIVAESGALALESMLGWPAVARDAAEFEAYSLALLRPRSLVVAVSESGETATTLEAARAARAKGAQILALTHRANSPLAQAADGLLLVRSGDPSAALGSVVAVRQATAHYVALVAARLLKRHHPQLDALEKEFEKLPAHAEWVLGQLLDAARALARAATEAREVMIVGAGFYAPVARLAAELFRRRGAAATACLPEEISSLKRGGEAKRAVFALSGSRCRLKKSAHRLAEQARSAGEPVSAVTDTNDRELSDKARLALLLPVLHEMVGSSLALILLEWVAGLVGRGKRRRGTGNGKHETGWK
jgi:glucosamine--fructose-6-phosphate aminotransferase (isomerizing)